ncbi:MAG TPA: PAS domain S-box protein [Gemmatimonadales bacterium]|nr:PAS domain S-box protein [Gemmatimonadales bacterium]
MRLTRATAIAALTSLAAIAVAYALANTYAAKTWVANIAWTWCGAFAFWNCVRASWTVRGPGRTAWLVMGLCCAMWLTAQLRLDFVMLVQHLRSGDLQDFAQFGYQIDFALYFAMYVGFFVVLASLLRDKPLGSFDRRVVLDVALVTLTIGVLAYEFVVSSAAYTVNLKHREWVTLFGLPLGGVTVFWVILLRMIRRTAFPLATAGLAILGAVLFMTADVSYTWLLVRGRYVIGDPVDMVWDAGLLALAIAASQSAAEGSGGVRVTVSAAASRTLAVVVSLGGVIVGALLGIGFPDTFPGSSLFVLVGGTILALRLAYTVHSDLEYTARLEQEQERTYAALRESEERYSAAFEQAAVGLAEVALDGRFLRVNRCLCEALGYRSDELLQRHAVDVTHPDDVPDARRLLGRVPTLQAPHHQEKRYLRKDGSVMWANLTTSLVRDAEHQPKFFISVIEDLTQRKRLEQQLLHAQKLEALGQLAGGVAHDFNNVLGVMLGYTQIVERTLPDGDPRRADVGEIRKAGLRAADLIAQLLAFARKSESIPQVIDLSPMVAGLDRILPRVLGENITLRIDLQPKLPPVKVDPSQFEQVMLNLAINARDAMPEGGTLSIETDVVWLDQDYVQRHPDSKVGRHVMIAVSDTGTGISREVLSRIFEPFFTTKAPGRGTGLGLAMCYGIIKQAGGNIWAYSEPGEGTTFRLYLPTVGGEAPAAAEAVRVVDLPRGDEVVLIAEDDPQLRQLNERILRECGYAVLVAEDGEEALELARHASPPVDILVTDMVMPDMNGLQVADQLLRSLPDLKVLCVTGYAAHRTLGTVRERGFGLLQKPFTTDELARRVRNMLDGRISGSAAGAAGR